MYVGWQRCEFGAPEIDPKRPYGNSDVYQDMVEIIGLEKIEDEKYRFRLDHRKWTLYGENEYNLEFPDDLTEALDKLHLDMQTALQIVLCTQMFKTGPYYKENEYDDRSWQYALNEIGEYVY